MENKKFMLGDEPKSYPPSPPLQAAYEHVEPTTISPLPSAVLSNTTSAHIINNSNKRPIRHLAKRRSSGTRFMKRSTSMEDTSKARMRRSASQQRLQTFSPMPIMTQVSNNSSSNMKHKVQQQPRLASSSRNNSNSTTSSSRTALSSFIVSSMECAKPIEQTFHATANSLSPCPTVDASSSESTNNNEPLYSSATKALRYVSASSSPSNIRHSSKPIASVDKRYHHQHEQRGQQQNSENHTYQPCLSIQQQTPEDNLDDGRNPYQKMMDDQYQELQQYYQPMLTSLVRCLDSKMSRNSKQARPPTKLTITPNTSSGSASLFVPTTTITSPAETATHHQRHHSHSGDCISMGGHYQQQQQQQQIQPIHADQRQIIHKNHMKKILLHNDMQQQHLSIGDHSSATQHGPSIVSSSDFVSPAKRSFALSMGSSSSASTSSPWVTSIWDRVWNGLIKA